MFFMKHSLVLYMFITWTQRKFLFTPYDKLNGQFLIIMIDGIVNVTERVSFVFEPNLIK